MEQRQKNDFSQYSREQLLQIIENKDEEIDFVWSELNWYTHSVSIFLVIVATITVLLTIFR
jgi:hypothetical protein